MAGVVKFTLDADDAKAVGAFMRVVDAQKKTERGSKKLSETGKKTGTNLVGGMKNVVMSLTAAGGVMGAVSKVTAAFKALNEERKKGAVGAKMAEFDLAQLAQLVDTQKEFKKLVQDAKDYAAATGMATSAGGKFIFTLKSMGLYAKKDLFEKLAISGTIRPEESAQLVEAITKVQTAFGKEEAGTVEQILNKLLAASKKSPATVTQFGPAMTLPGQAVSMIKGTEEETAATIAILAKATQSIEVGATQTRALATVIAKQGLGGEGLFKGIEKIEEMEFDDQAAMIKFFGRKEAVAGYMGFLKNKEAIFELEKEVIKAHEETGKEADFTRRMLEMPGKVPSIAAARRARISKQGLQSAQEREFGTQELTREAVISEIATEATTGPGKRTGFGRYAQLQVARPAAFFGAGEQGIRTAAEMGSPESLRRAIDFMLTPRIALEALYAGLVSVGKEIGQRMDTSSNEKTADKLDKAAEKISKAADKTDKAMDNMSRGITSRN